MIHFAAPSQQCLCTQIKGLVVVSGRRVHAQEVHNEGHYFKELLESPIFDRVYWKNVFGQTVDCYICDVAMSFRFSC